MKSSSNMGQVEGLPGVERMCRSDGLLRRRFLKIGDYVSKSNISYFPIQSSPKNSLTNSLYLASVKKNGAIRLST